MSPTHDLFVRSPSRRPGPRGWRSWLTLVLLTALMGPMAPAGAQNPQPAGPSQNVDDTLDQVRDQIDGMQKELKDNGEHLDDTALQNMRAKALSAQAQAAQIAEQLSPQLAGIQARLAELGTPVPGTKEDPDVAAQRALLAKNNGAFDAELKLARLLSLEGEQLAAQLWTQRRSQFQARLGERTHSILATTFWVELRDDLPRDANRIGALGHELSGA
ncbi:MAG: DUF3772 domain-containing protein, partial [Pseudomonadota bacterium]|nr:DUF3772 domain-containing protein [Pseudomonadota bacterium]